MLALKSVTAEVNNSSFQHYPKTALRQHLQVNRASIKTVRFYPSLLYCRHTRKSKLGNQQILGKITRATCSITVNLLIKSRSTQSIATALCSPHPERLPQQTKSSPPRTTLLQTHSTPLQTHSVTRNMFQQAAVFVGALTGVVAVSQALSATKEYVAGKRKRENEDDRAFTPYCLQTGHNGAIVDSSTGCKHCRQTQVKRPRYIPPPPKPPSTWPSSYLQYKPPITQDLLNQSAERDARNWSSIYKRVLNIHTGRAARADAQYTWRKAQEKTWMVEKEQREYEEALARGQHCEQLRRKGMEFAIHVNKIL